MTSNKPADTVAVEVARVANPFLEVVVEPVNSEDLDAESRAALIALANEWRDRNLAEAVLAVIVRRKGKDLLDIIAFSEGMLDDGLIRTAIHERVVRLAEIRFSE